MNKSISSREDWRENEIYAILPILDCPITTDGKMNMIKKIVIRIVEQRENAAKEEGKERGQEDFETLRDEIVAQAKTALLEKIRKEVEGMENTNEDVWTGAEIKKHILRFIQAKQGEK